MTSGAVGQTRAEVAVGSRWRSYLLAALGPVVASGAQFLLSVQLVHALPMAEFGRFALLLVLSQFSLGLGSALVVAPYPALMRTTPDPVGLERTLLAANLAFALLVAGALGAVGFATGGGGAASMCFALYGGIMVLRSFARARAYQHHAQMAVVGSDVVYGAVLAGAMGAMAALGQTSIELAYFALLAGAVAGLAPFGRSVLALLPAKRLPSVLDSYLRIWRQHSSWSLLGVATTEATANAHVYIVTLLDGPAAYAPIAASALLIRPAVLAMNALTDLERPQVAKRLEAGGWGEMRDRLASLRAALLVVWAGTLGGAIALLGLAPDVVFPGAYDTGSLWIGAALWMLIALVRIGRTPESVLLQAGGAFRTLALASVASALVSMGAVAGLAASGDIVWSLGGILVGETVFAAGVWARARRIVRSSAQGSPA